MSGTVLDRLVDALRAASFEFTAEDFADALWLAPRLPRRPDALESLHVTEDEAIIPPVLPPPPGGPGTGPVVAGPDAAVTAPEKSKPEGVDVHLPGPAVISGERFRGVLVRLPDAAGLPEALAMARAMRPFRKRQPTTRFVVLDESRTAERLAASDIWLPVLSPGQERWLSAAVVIDCGASMAVWQTVLREFRHLLETLGAFRTVAEWWLDTEDPAWTLGADSLTPLFASRGSRVYRRPLDVVDPSGRQFILVVSDCVSDVWWDGRMARLLRLWGRINQTSILQVLPRTMWERTALGPEHEQEIVLRSPRPACPNSHLAVVYRVSDPCRHNALCGPGLQSTNCIH